MSAVQRMAEARRARVDPREPEPSQPARAVIFLDEEPDVVSALQRAFDSGSDEVFLVAPERLFQNVPDPAPPLPRSAPKSAGRLTRRGSHRQPARSTVRHAGR